MRKVCASRGHRNSCRGGLREAEQLAREAVAITERTTLGRALERYQQKKNLAMSAQVRDRLAELQGLAPR